MMWWRRGGNAKYLVVYKIYEFIDSLSPMFIGALAMLLDRPDSIDMSWHSFGCSR
jgi:hypothetical protein